MSTVFIPCMNCGKQQTNNHNFWYVCDKCGYRICVSCVGRHEGPYGNHGKKCSQCMHGYLEGPVKLE